MKVIDDDNKLTELLYAVQSAARAIKRRIPPPKAEILVGEASRRLGFSRAWVRQLADTGKLKTRKTADGFLLFDAKEVDDYAREKGRYRAAPTSRLSR